MTETVRLIRRVSFSAGHRFWNPAWSEAENKRLYGPTSSPYNHGHNYVLDVSTEGKPARSNGMVVNIKTIDDVLQRHIVGQFDGRSLNDEVPRFASCAPTLENLLLFVRDELHVLPAEADLVGLRLQETPDFWATLEKDEIWKMTLTRCYEFAASHRLFIPGISDERNEELFGKCANPSGHGHNYLLAVTVTGVIDPDTGMMVDLMKMDEVINQLVIDRYDHKNLNVDLPEFQGRVTTSEVVTQEIFRVLDGKLPAKLDKVALQETARSTFEVSAE